MNNQMLNFAQQLVKTNQNNIPNAPWRDAAINAILSGDAQAGQQMAQNLMQSMGMTKEQIIQTANYRALHDELVSYQMQQKDDVIAELRSQVQALNLGVSQRNQNDYLIDRLQPCAKPAYFVPNPNCCYTPQQYAQFAGASCGGCCC